MARLDIIFEATRQAGIAQLVDAEQTYFQATIDAITLYFIKKFVLSFLR
jgi:hypothetical protein